MEAEGQRRFLSAVLMSYAKEGDLTGALNLIKQLKKERLASSSQRQSAQGQEGPPAGVGPTETAGTGYSEHHQAGEEPLRHDGGGSLTEDKQWTPEDGMRYLLMYTEVEKLYK